MAQSHSSGSNASEPWRESWEFVAKMSAGSQGKTSKVKRIGDGQIGVLKKLKYPKRPKARSRMRIEVASLEVLHSAGCKVPEVFDGNTVDFKDLKVPLYFVMEYIEGQTLSNLLAEKGPLGPAESIRLVLDLAATMKIAHDIPVFHRDLKPGNIIVRSLDDGDAVMIDYGLSFNRAETGDETDTSEPIGNQFMRWPEGHADSDDKRDSRTDIGGLCAILYFCLTGEQPRVPRDGKDQPPHRRPGGSIEDAALDANQRQALETFFDVGFQQSIDLRFQKITEIEGRLAGIRDRPTEVVGETLADRVARSSDVLVRSDRNSQLAELGKTARTVIKRLNNDMAAANAAGDLGPYVLNPRPLAPRVIAPPGDDLNQSAGFVIESRAHPGVDNEGVLYQVQAHDMKCVLYRVALRAVPPPMIFEDLASKGGSDCAYARWEEVLRFHGLVAPPHPKLIQDELHRSIGDAVDALQTRILQSR